MMPRALALPLLLALSGCTRRAEPPRALPPTPPPTVDATPVDATPVDATPVDAATEPMPLRDVVAVSSSPYASGCALQRDGHVWCWGPNACLWAPVGPVSPDHDSPAYAAPTQGLDEATALCLSHDFVCVLRRDRSVRCRIRIDGDNADTGQTTSRVAVVTPTGLGDVTGLAQVGWTCVATNAAGQHLLLQYEAEGVVGQRQTPPRSCTLSADETRCVGSNSAGLLANETTATFTAASPARLFGLRGVRDVVWSESHACAALGDGTVRCWGRNLHAQLGTADLRSRALPTAVPGLDGVVSLAATTNATCAVRSDGTVWCWGTSSRSLLGAEGEITWLTPRPIAGIGDVASLTLSEANACALRRDGQLWCWGDQAPRSQHTPPWQPHPMPCEPTATTPPPPSPG